MSGGTGEPLVAFLLSLLSADTRSGGGGETSGLAAIRDRLESSGVGDVAVEGDGAPYLFAEVPGRKPSGGLLLFSHIDTGGWDLAAWRHAPLGELDGEGMIWGRGALDCKSVVAVHTFLLMRLAGDRRAPGGPVGMVVTTDEETGEGGGMRAFCRQSDRLKRYTQALGEGGGYILSPEPLGAVSCQVGECGRIVYPAPGVPDAAEVLLDTVAPRLLPRLPRVPGVSRISERAMRSALTVRQGTAIVRVPPGCGRKRIEAELHSRGLLTPGTEGRVVAEPRVSDARGTLYRGLRRIVRDRGRTLVPVVTPGFGDARFLREAGLRTFGLFPIGLREQIGTMHAPDEAIHARTLLEARDTLWSLVLATR